MTYQNLITLVSTEDGVLSLYRSMIDNLQKTGWVEEGNVPAYENDIRSITEAIHEIAKNEEYERELRWPFGNKTLPSFYINSIALLDALDPDRTIQPGSEVARISTLPYEANVVTLEFDFYTRGISYGRDGLLAPIVDLQYTYFVSEKTMETGVFFGGSPDYEGPYYYCFDADNPDGSPIVDFDPEIRDFADERLQAAYCKHVTGSLPTPNKSRIQALARRDEGELLLQYAQQDSHLALLVQELDIKKLFERKCYSAFTAALKTKGCFAPTKFIPYLETFSSPEFNDTLTMFVNQYPWKEKSIKAAQEHFKSAPNGERVLAAMEAHFQAEREREEKKKRDSEEFIASVFTLPEDSHLDIAEILYPSIVTERTFYGLNTISSLHCKCDILETEAFACCENLTEIEVEARKFGKRCFADCPNLEKASIATSRYQKGVLSPGIFAGCKQLKSIELFLERGMTLRKNTFGSLPNLEELVIEGGGAIAEGALRQYPSLKKVHLAGIEGLKDTKQELIDAFGDNLEITVSRKW